MCDEKKATEAQRERARELLKEWTADGHTVTESAALETILHLDRGSADYRSVSGWDPKLVKRARQLSEKWIADGQFVLTWGSTKEDAVIAALDCIQTGDELLAAYPQIYKHDSALLNMATGQAIAERMNRALAAMDTTDWPPKERARHLAIASEGAEDLERSRRDLWRKIADQRFAKDQ